TSYDATTNAFTRVVTTGGGTGYQTGTIDPVRRRFYIIDTNANPSEGSYVDLGGASPSFHRVTVTGNSGWRANGFVGVAHDPVGDRMVIWGGGDTVYTLNTATHVSAAFTGYTGGPGAAQTNGTFGRWQYSPALNAFVVINSIDQDAFVFRLSGGTGTPPPTD